MRRDGQHIRQGLEHSFPAEKSTSLPDRRKQVGVRTTPPYLICIEKEQLVQLQGRLIIVPPYGSYGPGRYPADPEPLRVLVLSAQKEHHEPEIILSPSTLLVNAQQRSSRGSRTRSGRKRKVRQRVTPCETSPSSPQSRRPRSQYEHRFARFATTSAAMRTRRPRPAHLTGPQTPETSAAEPTASYTVD